MDLMEFLCSIATRTPFTGFGNYILDLSTMPAPLPFTLSERRSARANANV